MIVSNDDNDFVERFFSKIQSLHNTHENERINTFTKCFIEKKDIELSKQALLNVIKEKQEFKQIDFDAFDDNYLWKNPLMKNHFDKNTSLKNDLVSEFEGQYAILISKQENNYDKLNADNKDILQQTFIGIYIKDENIDSAVKSNLTTSIENLVNYLADKKDVVEFFKKNQYDFDKIQALCNKIVDFCNEKFMDFLYFAKLTEENSKKSLEQKDIGALLLEENIKQMIGEISQDLKLKRNNDKNSNDFYLLSNNKNIQNDEQEEQQQNNKDSNDFLFLEENKEKNNSKKENSEKKDIKLDSSSIKESKNENSENKKEEEQENIKIDENNEKDIEKGNNIEKEEEIVINDSEINLKNEDNEDTNSKNEEEKNNQENKEASKKPHKLGNKNETNERPNSANNQRKGSDNKNKQNHRANSANNQHKGSDNKNKQNKRPKSANNNKKPNIYDILQQHHNVENVGGNADERQNNNNIEHINHNENINNQQDNEDDREYYTNIIRNFVNNATPLPEGTNLIQFRAFYNRNTDILQHKSAFFWLNEQERRNNVLLDFIINNNANQSLETLNNRLRHISGGKCSWCCGDW